MNYKSISLISGTLLLSTLSANGQKKDSKPNIIFILCDDMGYGDLGCYGQPFIRTPHIDAMASEGMRFTQAYAGSPVSAPSRASFIRPSAEEAAENFIASKTACHPAGYWVRDGNPLTHFLQEDNRMAYRVKAYTLREESTESGTRYFISFKDGQGKSHELEVSEQFFMEFRQMERRNRNLF